LHALLVGAGPAATATKEGRLSEDSVVIQSVERRYVIRGERCGQSFAWDVSQEAFNRLRLQMDEAERCEACRAFDEAAEVYHEAEKQAAQAEVAALEQVEGDASGLDPDWYVKELAKSRLEPWEPLKAELERRREHAQEQQAGNPRRIPEYFPSWPPPSNSLSPPREDL
jgi:hypothetical protein